MDSLIAANVKQRPLRTAVSVAGVALGVVLIVLNVGFARGMMRDSVERQSNVDAEVRFLPGGDVSLTSNPLILPTRYADAILHGVQPTPEYPDLEEKPPVEGVAEITPVGEWVQSVAGGLGYELVDGIDFPTFVKTTSLKVIEGRPMTEGSHEAIVDRRYVDYNTAADGGPVGVGSEISVLGHRFTVVGIYEPPLLARVKIPLSTMQEMFGGTDNCSFLMIKTERPELADQVIQRLKQYYPGNRVISTDDIPALFAQSLFAVNVFIDIVVGLASVISALVILLAMYTTIIERTREIGILKSLGASKGFIVSAIEKEAAFISALGVSFGFIVAVAGKLLIESSTRLMVDVEFKWLVIAAAIGMLGGTVGAFYPAMRAAKLDPIEALSYE